METKSQSEIEKKINEAASSFEPFNYGNSREEQEDAFKAGAKFILEMPEVREVVEALRRAHDCMGNAGQTAWDGNDELKRMILSKGRQELRDSIDKLRELGVV